VNFYLALVINGLAFIHQHLAHGHAEGVRLTLDQLPVVQAGRFDLAVDASDVGASPMRSLATRGGAIARIDSGWPEALHARQASALTVTARDG